jgi:hypothetical protein
VPRWVDPLVVALLAVGALAASLAVSRLVFPHFSMNNDEPVYVFQARMLLDHRLTLPAADAVFFRPWMSGQIGDHLVMVFPPVLPALLALGQLVLGSMAATLGVLAAVGVALVAVLTRQVTGDRRAGLLAPLVLAVCPLFVIQSGLFLSYVLALDLELALAILLVAGARRQRARWFVAGGVALGVLCFARPFDAVLVGVPFLAVGLTHRAARVDVAARRAAAVLAGAVPFVTLSLVYNARVTGAPFRLPLAAIGGNDSAGFGYRQLSVGTPRVHYGVHEAVAATVRNLATLPGWVPGGVVLLGSAVVGLLLLRRSAWPWALTAVAVTVPFGYLFYWGNLLIVRGQPTIGPHYYLAVLLPVVVLGSAGLAELSRRWRPGLAVVAVLLLVTSATSLDTRIRRNERQVALHDREAALLRDAHLRDALVILPSEPPDGAWLMHPRPSFMNDPGLRGSVLFATDHGGANFALVDRFPGRALYRQFSRVPPGERRPVPQPTLWRLQPRTAARYTVHVHVRNTDGSPVVAAYVAERARSTRYIVDRASRPGATYELTWSVSPTGIELLGAPGPPDQEPPGQAQLTVPGSAGTLAVGVSFGGSTSSVASAREECRFWYRTRADGRAVDLMLPGEVWQFRSSARPQWLGQDVGADFAVSVATA